MAKNTQKEAKTKEKVFHVSIGEKALNNAKVSVKGWREAVYAAEKGLGIVRKERGLVSLKGAYEKIAQNYEKLTQDQVKQLIGVLTEKAEA